MFSSIYKLTLVWALATALGSTNASSEIEIDSHGNVKSSFNEGTSHDANDSLLDCGLWLAPSTIPGAGLGMYAGVDVNEGDELLRGGDSVIVIADIAAHNAHKAYQGYTLLDAYTWDGFKATTEGLVRDESYAEGIGAAVNCFLPLHNVNMWDPRRTTGGGNGNGTTATTSGLHRSKDPGAGACTIFHHRKSTARYDMDAGAELFLTYGEDWFTARPYLGPVPLTNDLDEATAVFAKFTELQETLTRSHVADALTIATDVWTTFVKDTAFRDSRVLRGGFKHDDADFLHQLTTLYDNDVTAAHVAASTRSIEWLRRYGTCADHMVAQPSTVPQAGMGAFATRTIPTDTIVAYMPLLFIADRTCLEMFKLGPSQKGQWAPIDDTVIGQQLLLNYCYGHAESTVLLCPYGSMVNYVNHNQSRANVRVQWGRASKGNFVPDLLNQTVDAIESSGSVTGKLAMEMVATREIQPGEEILMDYGDEWEAAWTAHVRDWQPVPGASTYKSALQLEEDTTSRLRSIYQELRNKTYSDNVQMMCDTAIDTKPAEVEMHYRAGTLDEYLYQPDAEWWPCSILHSRLDEKGINGEYVYTIHLHELDHGDRPSSGVLIEDVPRGVIHFVDLPGSSDTFLPNAFRHHIAVPDSLFPNSWRNLAVGTSMVSRKALNL